MHAQYLLVDTMLVPTGSTYRWELTQYPLYARAQERENTQSTYLAQFIFFLYFLPLHSFGFPGILLM